MNIVDLQHIISQGESETVEFKQSFSKAVIETIVAFSNTKGGKVIIGVNDIKDIVGVSVTDETVQKWINEIKQNTEPAIYPIIDIVNFEGNTVVIFTINEFPIKPVAFKDRFFLRKHNSNHKLSVDEISELRFTSLNYSFDAFEVETSFEQLDNSSLQYFIKKVKDSGRFKLTNNIKQDLIKLGLIKNGKLTRATELLFGLHHTNIHIGRFKSETTIIDDLMIRSPLVLAVDEAMDFIKKNIRLGFEFGGETTKRTEKWQFPIPAIRELLLNAIVHRDYTNPTDVIIKIFDETIEITNPGKLMGDLTVEKIESGDYISQHRNKLLTEVFYLTGDIEKYGTGFRRIAEWFKDYPNLNYKMKELSGYIQLKIYPVNVPVNVPVNDRQRKILYDVLKNNRITQAELAYRYNVNRETIKRDLKKLKELNLIKRIGPAKGGHWEIINR